MRLKNKVLAVLMGAVLATSAHAQGTGRSLDIQPGARWNGMGSAGVAVADDATGATWWNPAGLGFAERGAIELTYAPLVPGLANDVSYNFATWVRPVEGWGAFGLGLVFLSYGTTELTNEGGGSLGTYGPNEVSPAFYYGTRLLPDLSVGASLKYIRIQLAPDSYHGVGSTFGLDLGAIYKVPPARLSLGVNVQNMGPSVTFINEDQASPLSRNVDVGAAWTPVQNQQMALLMVADFRQYLVTAGFRVFNGGFELRYADQIAGRLGYYYDPTGDLRNLTYGLGINWKKISFDMAGIPQATGLEYVKKITLGYHF